MIKNWKYRYDNGPCGLEDTVRYTIVRIRRGFWIFCHDAEPLSSLCFREYRYQRGCTRHCLVLKKFTDIEQSSQDLGLHNMVLIWKLTILKLRNFKIFCKRNHLIINKLSISFKNYQMLRTIISMPQDSTICHYTRTLFQFHVQEKRDCPIFLKYDFKYDPKYDQIDAIFSYMPPNAFKRHSPRRKKQVPKRINRTDTCLIY